MTPDEFKKKRGQLGCSINEMAQLINVNPRTIRHYEGGQRAVSNTVIRLLELNDRLSDLEHDLEVSRNVLVRLNRELEKLKGVS